MTTTVEITRLSPAKINLFLHITGKRPDGYHNLQTVFRLLDWGDYLHFLAGQSIKLSHLSAAKAMNQHRGADTAAMIKQLIILSGAENIKGELTDNLIIKAAHALLLAAINAKKLPAQLPSIRISLDKRLPMGAGLGGGSSNAATTLLVLNQLWQLNFSRQQLQAIAVTLGADVPIFIFGQDALAMGIGEQLTAIDLPAQRYLVLTPNAHIDTGQLFAHPQLRRDIAKLPSATIKAQAEQYIQALEAPYHNVFGPVVESLASTVATALQYLRSLESQALGAARMTGSGSAVFLPLANNVAENKALLDTWVVNAPCPAYIVSNL
jgi:4-diphosphocytidyl-2-C-methyl-D-erythritol kinase